MGWSSGISGVAMLPIGLWLGILSLISALYIKHLPEVSEPEN
jgi:hypothetical protein